MSCFIDTPIDNITASVAPMSLDELLSMPVDASLADDALCSLVDGANSLYLQLDEEEADTSSVMGVVDMLYDELTRRIDASAEIQLVSPLLRALYDAIYGRDIDTQGGDDRVYFYMDATARMVDSYRRWPILDEHAYIFHLTSLMPCMLPAELQAVCTEVAAITGRWAPYHDPAAHCWTDCTPAESRRRASTLHRLCLYLPELVHVNISSR